MNPSAANLLETLLWSIGGGLLVWLILTPVRRRSLSGLFVTLVLTGSGASTGALWGASQSDLVPDWGWRTMFALTAFALVVTAVAALAAARRLGRDAESLRRDVLELSEGRIPEAEGKALTAEVEDVRRELRMAALDLATARQRERDAEIARRELVSGISHDLRTPLAGLRAMAEALEDGVVDDPTVYYKQIGASVERLNQMVEDLFDLSRIQAGGMSRQLEPVVLARVVADALKALRPVAYANHVRIEESLQTEYKVKGNFQELGRAITNLVSNGIRHTRTDGWVRVTVGQYDDRRLLVDVRDECGGIDPQHLNSVFEVGFRGQQSRTQGANSLGGAGLGLAITRGIVIGHGGTISVANIDGGCRFRVLLPLI